MKSQHQDWINLHHSKSRKKVKMYLGVITVKDNDNFVFIIPSLNLSSYGETYEEAKEMMDKIVLNDFCESLMALPLPEILKELHSLGWSNSPFFAKELSRTSYIDKQGLLKDFDISEDAIIEESTIEVC
jgi:predicted RNase H-like HicB family nuclease